MRALIPSHFLNVFSPGISLTPIRLRDERSEGRSALRRHRHRWLLAAGTARHGATTPASRSVVVATAVGGHVHIVMRILMVGR